DGTNRDKFSGTADFGIDGLSGHRSWRFWRAWIERALNAKWNSQHLGKSGLVSLHSHGDALHFGKTLAPAFRPMVLFSVRDSHFRRLALFAGRHEFEMVRSHHPDWWIELSRRLALAHYHSRTKRQTKMNRMLLFILTLAAVVPPAAFGQKSYTLGMIAKSQGNP